MTARVEAVAVRALRFPTDQPESDGTLRWDSTGLVLVEARADGVTGLGYSYTHEAAAALVAKKLAGVVRGRPAADVEGSWQRLWHSVRNLGQEGVAASAISAVDVALWDLKARLLEVSLLDLLGAARNRVPAYGSGGFTSYADDRLQEQLAGWVERGLQMVKMKVGREPERDSARVRAAREVIGDAALFVDGNGAWDPVRAVAMAHRFADFGVEWLEEPVSSDDLAGLAEVRAKAPPGMAVAAGEYGWSPFHFQRLLAAGAADVLQPDATRCLGITGFLKVAALCEAACRPLSAHCAPALHAHLGCAAARAAHVEYFYDHARIEDLLFEGVAPLEDGDLVPDRGSPGLGLSLRPDVARHHETTWE